MMRDSPEMLCLGAKPESALADPPLTGEVGVTGSSSFSYLTGFDTARADSHSADAALRFLNTDRLQVWIENARCPIVGMRNIVAELWSFTANITTLSHDY